jgi:hypothetical protein
MGNEYGGESSGSWGECDRSGRGELGGYDWSTLKSVSVMDELRIHDRIDQCQLAVRMSHSKALRVGG